MAIPTPSAHHLRRKPTAQQPLALPHNYYMHGNLLFSIPFQSGTQYILIYMQISLSIKWHVQCPPKKYEKNIHNAHEALIQQHEILNSHCSVTIILRNLDEEII